MRLPIHRQIRHLLALFLLYGSTNSLFCNEREENRIQILKNHLQSKHETGELVYITRTLGGTITLPERTVTIPSQSVAYRAKWQPGAQYVMALDGTNEVDSPARDAIRSMVGQVGERRWVYAYGSIRIFEASSSPETAQAFENNGSWAKGRIPYALGFGLMYEPGSFAWNGNEFSAKSIKSDETYQGELIYSDSDLPGSIVRFAKSKDKPDFNIDLDYGPRGASRLPVGFKASHHYPDGRIDPFEEVQILTLSTTNAVLPEREFEPEAILARMDAAAVAANQKVFPLRTLVYSNGQSFAVKSNRMNLVRSEPTQSRLPAALFIVIAAVVFPLFFWISKLKMKSTNERKT